MLCLCSVHPFAGVGRYPFYSAAVCFGCWVKDSCLVAGDDFRSQAASQPARHPGGLQGELSPITCKEAWAGRPLKQAFCNPTGPGETQLCVSVFIHDSKPARLHRHRTDYYSISIIHRKTVTLNLGLTWSGFKFSVVQILNGIQSFHSKSDWLFRTTCTFKFHMTCGE